MLSWRSSRPIDRATKACAARLKARPISSVQPKAGPGATVGIRKRSVW